jgi:hypothetical protein
LGEFGDEALELEGVDAVRSSCCPAGVEPMRVAMG